MNTGDEIQLLLELVQQQAKRIQVLEEELRELKHRLNQDSSNSSKPPSSDPIFNRPSRIGRKKKTGNKPGGQKGHKGHKLKKYEQADFEKEYHLAQCPNCKEDQLEIVGKITRQVLDIPVPRIEATDHIFYSYSCKCCKEIFRHPKHRELNQQVQYGANIKSLVNYLNVYQIIPYKRLTQLLEVLYGHKISQGSISNFNREASLKLVSFISQLKQNLSAKSQVVNADETGCMVSKQLSWVHVYSNRTVTLLEGSEYRGKKAIDKIGILPQMQGTIIHDRFGSYFQYTNVKHGLCNAHILRDIKAAQINNNMVWLENIKQILLRSKNTKDKGRLTKNSAKIWQTKFENILRNQRVYYQKQEELLRKKKPKGNLKRPPDHKLFIAFWKYRKEILLFLHDLEVPFDNNQAERDLRMLKVKMKVSNQFKSLDWLNVHASIRSFISTAQKQKLNLFQCLENLHRNPISAVHLTV